MSSTRIRNLALLSVVVVAPLQAQRPDSAAFPSDSAILALLRQRVNDKRATGIVVGLLEPEGHTRVISFGDPGPGQPSLDGNSVFEIGSITKVFTSTVLAEQVVLGKVHLDDPVQQYLPASMHVPTHDGKSITLGNLASQNSGLPRLPDNLQPRDSANPYADYTAARLADFLAHYQLPRDPGAQFEYSNLGVGLLGYALTRHAGKSYEEMERADVWNPLGMSHTGIALTPYMRQHLAIGHDADGSIVPGWDWDALAGAGAIRSTAQDMLKFASAYLHPGHGKLGAAVALAQQSRAPTTIPSNTIGLNWLIQRAAGDTIVWHDGGTGGYGAFVGFEPSRHRAIVILINSSGTDADALGMHLLDPAIPLVAPAPAVKQRVAIDVPVATLAKYVGHYQMLPTFAFDVRLEADGLHIQATGQQAFRLWAETPTDFFLKEVDAQITFVTDANGVVTGLILHQNGADVPAQKVKEP